MQTTKHNMKNYSILIKGNGPCGTGEATISADLLTQTLAQSLRDAGHDVTHASIIINDEALIIHGSMTTHPEPPEEKKGGAAPKKKGGAATKQAAPATCGDEPEPENTADQPQPETQESTDEPQAPLAADPA